MIPRLHVERRGKGKPTVWIHGWSAEAAVWSTFPDIPGREAILFDLPGHGRTPWAKDWTLTDVARAILAEIDGPADFVGWSLGGVASVACALLEPAKVRSIIILAMSNFGGERAIRMRDALQKNKYRALAEFYRGVWSDDDRRQPGFDAMQKDMARKRRLPTVEAMVGTYDVFLSGIPSLDLGAVTCPTFVLHGTADGVTPLARATELAGRLHAPLIPLEGAGHAPFLTIPGKCHELMDEIWAKIP